jgi:tetratricopeptide (TPR) repeat protein
MIALAVPMAVLAASLLTPLGGPAHRKTEEGTERYLAGELDRALAIYTEAQVAAPDAPELHYDIGNVLYRQGDFAGAAEAYERALVSAGPALKPLAAYNLGNAQFRQEEFSKAAESYRRALEFAPADPDAKRNLEIALRALEQQQKSEPQGRPDADEGNQEQQEPQSGGDKGNPEQQEQQKQQEQKRRENERDQDQQQQPGEGEGPSPTDGSMTPEQAARLLDGAADAERAARKEEAERAARVGDRSREKDW